MANVIGAFTAKKQLTDVIGGDTKDKKQEELPGGLSWGRDDSADTEESEAARARLRKYAAAHDPSPIAALNRTLHDVIERLKAGWHGDHNKKTKPIPGPMPVERSSVVSVTEALAAAKERLSQQDGHQPSTRDIRTALDVIQVATDKALNAATDMLVYLDDQLEQLDMIENALGRINGCMHDAEEDLKNLEKCCGLCTLPWNQQPNFEETKEYVDTWQEIRTSITNTTGPVRVAACLKYRSSNTASDVFIDRVTEDEREAKMNSNVQEITNKVNTLCDMVRDINIELTLQNQQLELVHHKALSVNERVRIDTKRSYKIADS